MCPKCFETARIVKDGFFKVQSKRRAKIQRYKCKSCGKKFSDQTFSDTCRQRKPYVNQPLFRLLCSGVSQRRAAIILGINRNTVAAKLVNLASTARAIQHAESKSKNVHSVIFDEMETFEHTKCKPLSITVAVENKSRRLIIADVASMPAKGLLAATSRKKYGLRQDHRGKSLQKMCRVVKASYPQLTEILSDQCPRYLKWTRKHFSRLPHKTFKGIRGCVVGQGELKATSHDPLFSLNHTCAMIRDNLKTMSRRTWCTTKKPERLQCLLDLYVQYHNQNLRGIGRLQDLKSSPDN
jgi:transposase-like protein